MTSLTLYLSIWTGFILVGFLLGLNPIQANIAQLYQDPVQGMYDIVKNGFENELFLVLILGSTLIAGGLTSVITGGGFSIMYVIPLGIVIGVLELFILPSQVLISADVIPEVQIVYVVFVGVLTVLTIASFTTGRN